MSKFRKGPGLVTGATFVVLAGVVGLARCAEGQTKPQGAGRSLVSSAVAKRAEAAFDTLRRRMVADQIEARGVKAPAVLAAVLAVPRHRFVPENMRPRAYTDDPLPIGDDQTISQPFTVAEMTELIRPAPGMRVLEVGTGSGYQAAVLSRCVAEVDTIEYRPDLGRRAASVLRELGYSNIQFRIGDGYNGWPERAPFDAIVVTAAPPELPRPLLDELKVGGRLVAPVGVDSDHQRLVVLTRTATGFDLQTVRPARFVPMVGKAREGKRPAP